MQLPPQPKSHWLLGNLPEFAADSLSASGRFSRDLGDVVRLRFANRRVFLITSPELTHRILVSEAENFPKSPIYKQILGVFLGNGLFTSQGDFWKRQRKLAAPAFHIKRIQAYADTMVAHTERLLSEWQAGEQRDISHDMMELTLSVVARTLFNTEIRGSADTIGRALKTILEISNEDMARPLRIIPPWLPTPGNLRRKQAIRELDQIVLGIIDERRRKFEDNGDLLSMLMLAEDENGERMTDRQLRDEAVTLVLAGHETTAVTLAWAFYLLAQHPDIEARLHAEVDQVLGERRATVEDLRQLRYTDMIIKESMRLFPPVPTIGRWGMQDTEYNGYTIPSHSPLLISVYTMHHDARWFPEPEAFKPERWEQEKSIPRGAYLPFGGGPRICIGNSFAQMEAVLMLATIAQRYQLRLAPDQQTTPVPVLTLRPQENIRVMVEARTKSAELSEAATLAAVGG